MSDPHKAVFDAIHALERPITNDAALAAGLAQLQDARQTQQFTQWMQTNGTKLVQLLNEAA